MPRRKEKRIVLRELQECVAVFSALKDDPIFDGYDLGTLTISVKEKIAPTIQNAERAAMFLESYLVANPNCCEVFQDVRYVSKQKLAKMMRVARTTLDKWIDDQLIIPTYFGSDEEIEIFDPYKILAQLKDKKNPTL